jgi:hypothetical protein
MPQRDTILKELTELNSALVNMGNQNAYAVPAGYFETLAENVMARIKALETDIVAEETAQLSAVVAGVSKQMPYEVPAGYFDMVQQSAALVAIDSENLSPKEELETISPLLGGLKKQTPYTVPDNYFETTIKKEDKEAPAKVVSIVSRKWWRYAAAAIVIGIVATASVMIINNRNADPVAKINKEIKKSSDKELNEFIEQFDDAELSTTETVSNEKEIKELLKDIPEAEMRQFIDETAVTGTDDEATNDILLLN